MDNPRFGLLLMAIAMLTIPMVDGIAKHLSNDFSPLFISWARYAASCLFILPIAFFKFRSGFLPQNNRRAHFFRTLCLVVSMSLYFLALKTTPMANAISAFFVGPIVATLIAVFFYREKVSWVKSLSLLVGFVGVLLIVRPDSKPQVGILLALASGVGFGVYLVATRIASSHSDPIKTLAFQALIGSLLLTPFALAYWKLPVGDTLFLFAALGGLSALTHIMSITAFRYAETTLLAPLVYLEIVGAIIIGYLFFGDIPTFWVWCGSGLIIGSGIALTRVAERRPDQKK